jgi:flagellar motor protein MotB
MIFKGYGGSQKLNEDESTEELKSENRRVEFKVLKM